MWDVGYWTGYCLWLTCFCYVGLCLDLCNRKPKTRWENVCVCIYVCGVYGWVCICVHAHVCMCVERVFVLINMMFAGHILRQRKFTFLLLAYLFFFCTQCIKQMTVLTCSEELSAPSQTHTKWELRTTKEQIYEAQPKCGYCQISHWKIRHSIFYFCENEQLIDLFLRQSMLLTSASAASTSMMGRSCHYRPTSLPPPRSSGSSCARWTAAWSDEQPLHGSDPAGWLCWWTGARLLSESHQTQEHHSKCFIPVISSPAKVYSQF